LSKSLLAWAQRHWREAARSYNAEQALAQLRQQLDEDLLHEVLEAFPELQQDDGFTAAAYKTFTGVDKELNELKQAARSSLRSYEKARQDPLLSLPVSFGRFLPLEDEPDSA
jgi:hypothetical protein